MLGLAFNLAGWLLLLFVCAFAIAISTPVRVRVAGVFAQPRPRIQVQMRFLGGLTPWVDLGGDSDQKRKKKTKPRKRKRKSRKGFVNRRQASALPRLIIGILRNIHLDRITADADFGMPDPADTGEIYGLLCPLAYALPGAEIALRPDFTASRLSGNVAAEFHVTPVALLRPALRFGWQAYGPIR